MFNYLAYYIGNLSVNGIEYKSIDVAKKALEGVEGQIVIVINKAKTPIKKQNNQDTLYQIKVKPYMVQPATEDFTFHDQWNDGTPMPMRIMVGRKLRETRGMVKMELWAEIVGESMTHCMKCGRLLSNPVSKYFGIGPECGGHNYINAFANKEELKVAVATMKQKLKEVHWTGWVIRSGIIEETILQ